MRANLIVRLALLIGVVVLLSSIPTVAQNTIDFDDVPQGTNINDHYQSLGVVFSCAWGIECVDGHVTVMEPPSDSPTEPSSPPNIVTTSWDLQFSGCFDDETAAIRATFDEPVGYASIVALNEGESDHAFLAAYSADDIELDFDGRLDFTGGSVLLEVVAPGIAYVEFSGWQDNGACFDDLTFGQPVPTVPRHWLVPLMLALMLGGLALLFRR